MLKLFLLATVLATVSANILEKYVGNIIPTMAYPKDFNIEFCFNAHMSLPSNKCKCDGITLPAVKYEILGEESVMPVQIVEDETEARDALKKQCTCDKKSAHPSAFLPINDNFFLVYAKDSPTEFNTVLFAKTKATPKELSDFISSTEFLKDKTGDLICTTKSVDPFKDLEHKGSQGTVSAIKQVLVKH